MGKLTSGNGGGGHCCSTTSTIVKTFQKCPHSLFFSNIKSEFVLAPTPFHQLLLVKVVTTKVKYFYTHFTSEKISYFRIPPDYTFKAKHYR